ncbi:type II toxin-antitoxin system HicA family toxin [Patescibacteria group bacterium]|nr:type II toxin-antitoxin system HicA family toxin [Patescibacteria group bacterium]MBU4512912.1 type II toxin-antitoxin system HicA family toxin [Patescibacteria group bacterium]
MSSKLPSVKPKELIKALLKLGFIKRRQTGSHLVMRHPQTKEIVIIAIHPRDLKRGFLKDTLNQLGISVEEFRKLK